MSHAVYIAIPALRVVEFRANAGAYLQGIPQPTTIAGLTHALGLALTAEHGIEMAQAPGVAYGVSAWSGFSGISLNKKQSSKADATKAAAIDDRVRASVTLSLIIELVLSDASLTPSPEQIVQQLERMRIQGGSLFNQAPVKVETELSDAVRSMPASAFFLSDASDTMADTLATTGNTVDALLKHISRPRDGSYKPRWVPALVGWRALTEAVKHPACKNAADALVVAEPAIGLAIFRSKGSFRGWSLDPDAPVFWRHTQEQVPSLIYLVKGTAPFVPTEFVF